MQFLKASARLLQRSLGSALTSNRFHSTRISFLQTVKPSHSVAAPPIYHSGGIARHCATQRC